MNLELRIMNKHKREPVKNLKGGAGGFIRRNFFGKKNSAGFTLMEIMVATTVFAIVSVSLLGLFNYVIKINRRGEALRQASQGMRSFVEFLVKEVRNGSIDYYVVNGKYAPSFNGSSPCVPGGTAGNTVSPAAIKTYFVKDNKLGIVNTDNLEECFYLGKSDGSYVDTVGGQPLTFATTTGNLTLSMQKSGVALPQVLTPPNISVQRLMFFTRPICDPYSSCADYAGALPHIQPSVGIVIQFLAKLPTGEQVPIYYQTFVSSNQYDVK